MLRLRLRRVGSKKQPSYRIVVAESTSPRDGRFVEVVGFYNPRTEPATIQVKEDRALYWLSVGAKPSEAVERLLKNRGTLDRLARLHAGESLESLAAEAEAKEAESEPLAPTTPEPEPEETPVEAVENVAETETTEAETETTEAETQTTEVETETTEVETETETEAESEADETATVEGGA